jgi:hypothetical protein
MFRYCLNNAAFIDRVVLSVNSDKKPTLDQLLDREDKGILSPKSRKSFYSRCCKGKAPNTGNPVQVLYGRVSRFPRVPPYRVVMRSEEVPLTGAQVNEVIRLLFPGATSVRPVLVELTFDLKSTSVNYLQRHVLHRARLYYEYSSLRGKTAYFGSSSSPWQLRIYDKAPGIVRVELILKVKLLSRYGIQQPDGIGTLRSLKLNSMFAFKKFSRPRIIEATSSWSDEYWREAVREWYYYGQHLNGLSRILGKSRSETDRIFPLSGVQRRVVKMQRNLIW